MNPTIGYPYSYGDELTPEAACNNLNQAVIYSVLLPALWWSNLESKESTQPCSFGGNSQPEFSRVLEQKSPNLKDFNQKDSVEPKQVLESTQKAPTALKVHLRSSDNTSSPSGPPSKFSAGSKAKGAAKKNFAKRQSEKNPTSRQSGGSPFVHGLDVKTQLGSRPGRNRNGLCGRFFPQSTPDPSNPGCASGPRSVTVLSSHNSPSSSKEDSTREITAHDGVTGRVTDKSLNHLTSKHGHTLGIDDQLPPLPNQKQGKYQQIRTRVNAENKKQFGDTLEKILQDPNTSVFPEVNIRGIKGRGYLTEEYGEDGFFIGIHTEGKFAGLIMKAQPVDDKQLIILEESNKID